MNLIIVESPTKSRTLQGFLGKNYKVLSSLGHVRDLPKSELGVDVEKNFTPKYVIPPKARKIISQLKKELAKAQEIILATDEDREGESIAWHLAESLNLKSPKRIVFHEITKSAIQEALKNPRQININLVDAQQARRILDRIVGYKLSPFLWKKVMKGLSAGRVQSVAVRLIAEREEEIKNFLPQEFWQIIALLKKQGEKSEFKVNLIKKDGKQIDRLEIKDKESTDKILQDLEETDYIVEKVEKKEVKRNPLPPFTTSTLQQTAWQKFRFPAKMTMSVAQKLYETGHITYHRTDSLNLSQISLNSARKFITDNFGKKYHNFRSYKAKGRAQEAHEAIRPTYPTNTPDSLKNKVDNAGLKIYTLIWQRFIACQMAPALFNSTSVEIKAGKHTFGATGQVLKFEGFLKVYPINFSENEMPELSEKEKLELIKIEPIQNFTEPPPRYNEASLIKALEKKGIGRPSTYAPIISTIQERNYIEKDEQKRFIPTETGVIVNSILVENFPEIVDVDFTAKMEKELDEVANGENSWQKTCEDFYLPFSKNLKEKYEVVAKKDLTVKTDKKCKKCGKPMVERLGKFGRFYACSGFPECKYTESLENPSLDIICPQCKKGKIAVKKTRRGKIFYGCNNFPKCHFALWDKPINEFCEKCKSIFIETKRGQIKCSNKDCETWQVKSKKL